MPLQVVGQGSGLNTDELIAADSKVKVGDPVELVLYIGAAPSPAELAAMKQQLIDNGVQLTNMAYESGILVIRYIKSEPVAPTGTGFLWWLIPTALAALGITIFSWRISTSVGSTIGSPIFIIAGVAALIAWYLLIKKPQIDHPQIGNQGVN